MKKKIQDYVGHQITIILRSNKKISGILLAIDTHMNIVLNNALEHKVEKKSASNEEEKNLNRELGLLIIRGDTIVSFYE